MHYLVKLTRTVTQEAEVFITTDDPKKVEAEALAWAKTDAANDEWVTVKTVGPAIMEEADENADDEMCARCGRGIAGDLSVTKLDGLGVLCATCAAGSLVED